MELPVLPGPNPKLLDVSKGVAELKIRQDYMSRTRGNGVRSELPPGASSTDLTWRAVGKPDLCVLVHSCTNSL